MRSRVLLFIVATLLGGVGGFLGSVVGGAGGRQMLFAGGYVGGVLIAPLTARIAVWRGWIPRQRMWWTALGAAAGFVLAATVAINTLSSPIGPVLSTLLVGAGAVIGRGRIVERPTDTATAARRARP